MTVRFRNVDFDCTAPLDRWPAVPKRPHGRSPGR